MANATHSTKPISIDLQKYKEKENRRPARPLNIHQVSSNSGSSGSLPKRYQSVFTEGTPLTSFGVRSDDNQPRSRSPPNHIEPQLHQRPLKPVKEFLSTHPIVDQQIDDRRRSTSQTNGFTRSQTEATVQNVNVALAKTLNKLRSEPLYVGPTSSRPMTSHATSYQSSGTTTVSNFYYQSAGDTKGPLPAELIAKRRTSSITSNNPPNGITNSRFSSGAGPLIVQQPARSIDTGNTRVSTPLRATTKSLDTGLHQLDRSNSNTVTSNEHFAKSKKSKNELNQPTIIRSSSRKQAPASRPPSADNQYRTLPEVSVNPHIQSSVQQNGDQLPHLHESTQNGILDAQMRSQKHGNYLNTGESHTNHHYIQVEPTNTLKRISSPVKHQQIIDVQSNILVQHQRPSSSSTKSPPNSSANILLPSRKDSLNEAYIERDHMGAQLLTIESAHTNDDNDSTSTLKQYGNQQERKKNRGISTAPPASPTTQELNRVWKKQKNKYSMKSATVGVTGRTTSKSNRPPGRLKNYGDESESETTATETQSKDEDMAGRHGLLPSDLGSDAWSDLTSEFSDTKFRKHRNIRTSTPNITRHSSSVSSKEVGQIRKQLTDLQIMYNDLLKLLDIDMESVRSSLKSSTSSQAEHHGRKHRFRKVMPVTSMRHSNIDMREVNQRFTRLESSIVTLAESIAKLSAQLQTQRVIKDDVHHLRQEVAELRQQIQHQTPRQPSSTPGGATPSQQPPPRLVTAKVQRLATINSTNPLNASTSYMPSISTMQRSTSIIDPRQARKIEQFFGPEAMLRYFLSLLTYEEYAPVLEQEKIGIYELPYISERKLQSFGIPYGPCARIIYEAQQYFISLLTLKSSGIDV